MPIDPKPEFASFDPAARSRGFATIASSAAFQNKSANRPLLPPGIFVISERRSVAPPKRASLHH